MQRATLVLIKPKKGSTTRRVCWAHFRAHRLRHVNQPYVTAAASATALASSIAGIPLTF
jgi:hypothetical protein